MVMKQGVWKECQHWAREAQGVRPLWCQAWTSQMSFKDKELAQMRKTLYDRGVGESGRLEPSAEAQHPLRSKRGASTPVKT